MTTPPANPTQDDHDYLTERCEARRQWPLCEGGKLNPRIVAKRSESNLSPAEQRGRWMSVEKKLAETEDIPVVRLGWLARWRAARAKRAQVKAECRRQQRELLISQIIERQGGKEARMCRQVNAALMVMV